MEIVSRSECGLVPPSENLPSMVRPEGFVIHWVGSGGLSAAPTRNESLAVWRQIQQESMNGIRGTRYADVPYSFAVDPMGLILEGRGWEHTNAANGSASYNNHTWSVCSLAGPGLPLTAAAQTALAWLTREGAKRYGAVSYVRPHSSIYATDCPGDDLRSFCPTLEAGLHVVPPPAYKVHPHYEPFMNFDNIVDTLAIPSGGAWLLAFDGTVFAVGRPGNSVVVGGPKGHGYWGPTRFGAKLQALGDGYSVIDTQNEKYDFPQ